MASLIWNIALQRASVLYGAWQLLHFSSHSVYICVCVYDWELETNWAKVEDKPSLSGQCPLYSRCLSSTWALLYNVPRSGCFSYSIATYNWPPFYVTIKQPFCFCMSVSASLCVYMLNAVYVLRALNCVCTQTHSDSRSLFWSQIELFLLPNKFQRECALCTTPQGCSESATQKYHFSISFN